MARSSALVMARQPTRWRGPSWRGTSVRSSYESWTSSAPLPRRELGSRLPRPGGWCLRPNDLLLLSHGREEGLRAGTVRQDAQDLHCEVLPHREPGGEAVGIDPHALHLREQLPESTLVRHG